MSKNELAGVDIHYVLELLELISLSISVIIEGCPHVQADKPNGLEDACTHLDGIKDRVLFVSIEHSFIRSLPNLPQTLPPLVGQMDPNLFALLYYCHFSITYYQQTILLTLHMVKTHEITMFDFSLFLFGTLTVKPSRGSDESVYPVKKRGFFEFYRVQRTHVWR